MTTGADKRSARAAAHGVFTKKLSGALDASARAFHRLQRSSLRGESVTSDLPVGRSCVEVGQDVGSKPADSGKFVAGTELSGTCGPSGAELHQGKHVGKIGEGPRLAPLARR
jgi:hypothetical protein